jgi:hypothetical protein
MGLFLTAALVSVVPASTIAVGKGGKRIAAWQKWIRFVSVTVPVNIGLFVFLMPLLRDWVYSLWKR